MHCSWQPNNEVSWFYVAMNITEVMQVTDRFQRLHRAVVAGIWTKNYFNLLNTVLLI
jgi:hypothetical protein